ncbi:LysR family transcriptional regulator, partial [Oenococcus oeni]
THAAKHLFITQPALSRTLKNEEEKLNVTLVDRTTKPIQLTYAGAEYLRGLQNIDTATKQLVDKMNDISQSKSGQLSIGLPETLGTLFLPQLIQLYTTKYPQYHLQIREMASTQAAKTVIDNQLDLYIGPKPIKGSHFIYRQIKPIHFNLIYPESLSVEKLSKIERLTQFQFLKAQNYIGIDQTMITGLLLNQFFVNSNLHIRPWIQLKNFQTILQLVNKGLGFTILPSYYQSIGNHVSAIQISPNLLSS